MKIDPNDYFTIDEAAAALGTNRRSIYRAAGRAADEGHEVFVKVFGKSLIPKKALPTLKHFYFPANSDRRTEMSAAWGRKGGEAKRDNLKKAASTSRRGGSGTAGKGVAGPREA